MLNIDCSSVRTVKVHIGQFETIEKKAKVVIITCAEDGRCIAFHRDAVAGREGVKDAD